MSDVKLKDRVDWGFIHELEGFESKGYVPKDNEKSDKTPSGVTIAGGFDIGQQSKKSLEQFAFTPALFSKLVPYAGVVGVRARNLIKAQPLQLSRDELEELDKKVRKVYFDNIQREYDLKAKEKFLSLDTAKQTVIISVGFQYGSLRRCPKFYKLVTDGLWDSVVSELENFGDAYGPRRKREARYLRLSLSEKKGNS